MTAVIEKNWIGLDPIQELPDEDDDYITDVSGNCQSCIYSPATSRFLHLDGREFFLCDYCFHLADHESDYGEDFESREYEVVEGFCESADIGYDDGYNSEDNELDEEWVEIKLNTIVK
jgi:hypothetical protein